MQRASQWVKQQKELQEQSSKEEQEALQNLIHRNILLSQIATIIIIFSLITIIGVALHG